MARGRNDPLFRLNGFGDECRPARLGEYVVGYLGSWNREQEPRQFPYFSR
jgi:hypothetical protein